MARAAIGIDIGGTNVKLGLVNEKGKVLLHDTFLTGAHASRKELLDKLVEHIEILKKEARYRKLTLVGIGIGAPGPIDVERGFVYFFPNIPGWENTPLKKILQKRTKLPVFLDNDANAMAWGEYCFGAGRGCKNMIGLTLGTGIGGGNRAYRGGGGRPSLRLRQSRLYRDFCRQQLFCEGSAAKTSKGRQKYFEAMGVERTS